MTSINSLITKLADQVRINSKIGLKHKSIVSQRVRFRWELFVRGQIALGFRY
ncbi:hypothetical protein COLO4_00101 [Corchorus olitorius]|uniref:Uncharacterized protein n=1 Tax=Corchorus olitorius TaxID=93759 RepID=A0A1R3L4N9_9ROSI|nr:hypothetical protein COLO4_00101 [Corchorus olitorius]